jgi:hypothetical protein
VSRCTAGQNRRSNDRHRWSAAKARRGGGRDTQGGGNRIRVYSNPCCTLFLQMPLLEVSPRGALQWSCIFGYLGIRALSRVPSLFLCAYDKGP